MVCENFNFKMLHHREIEGKKKIELLDNDTVLSYIQPKSYIFDASMSDGSENDTFTSVDIPLLVGAAPVYNMDPVSMLVCCWCRMCIA